ncbi:MAG: hypothetical protein IT445_12790 [Phycisphaeraceae bacterium]|nr:hypothetical protein [Phycisphaeraceae bacterium]
MGTEMLEPLTQFGIAGLMGLLWVWERRLSRQRETQLDAAHAELMRQREQQGLLVELVQHNTQTIERFDQTLSQMRLVLEQLNHELQNRHQSAA